MRHKVILSTILFCFSAAGCAELPEAGPDHKNILQGATSVAINSPETVAYNYALVDINQIVIANAVDIDPGSFFRSFGGGKGPAPEILIGRGDVLTLTVFESKSGGLFIPADAGVRPGNYVTLPNQIVDHDGKIVVPYAGSIQASGRSLPEIQRDIEDKLANRAIEPKVIAALAEQNASTVSVVGEVNLPKKVPLKQNGERILDVIALAGGIKFPGYETFVTLQRRKKKATIYFNTLVTHPEENIFIAQGDTVYVYREPRRFVAFGAVGVAVGVGASSALTGLSGQFSFDQERVSFAEGVAKAGGLLDERANPGQVFLYRIESRRILESMGVDLRNFPPEQDAVPTVYRANFRDPSSFFFAQQFPMRNKDVVYVSNAESVEVTKFLSFVRTVTSTVSGVTQDAALARKAVTYTTSGKASPF